MMEYFVEFRGSTIPCCLISPVYCRCARSPPRPVPWSRPVLTKDFERFSVKASQKRLPNWQSIPFDWFKDKLHGHIYRRPDGGAEVLELDGFVQMQVLHGASLAQVENLSVFCAEPLRR